MANYKQKLAVQYAATGDIQRLKDYHIYNGGNNLLYYAIKNNKLDCAKFIHGLYPNLKINFRLLANCLIKCDADIIRWVVSSNIVNSNNNELLHNFVYESVSRNYILTHNKSIENIRIAMDLGFNTDEPIYSNWQTANSKRKITQGVAKILLDYKVIKRSNKLNKIND